MTFCNGSGPTLELSKRGAGGFVNSTGKSERRTSTGSFKTAQVIGAHTCAGGGGLLDSPPAGKSTIRQLSRPPQGEERDDYRLVIVTLNGNWRVIACKHQIQWILQKRGGLNRWRSCYFCRTRAGLIQCAHEYAGEISGDALVVLLRLPERIGGATW
jgi:hypothetical protein